MVCHPELWEYDLEGGFDISNADVASIVTMKHPVAVGFLRARTTVVKNGGMGMVAVKIPASYLHPSPFQLR